MLELRLEREQDYFATETLTREAFWNVYRPGCDEHLLVRKLRGRKAFVKELDFVVAHGERVVANIMYAKMRREGVGCDEVVGFGPVCVDPQFQGVGIGTMLIEHSLLCAAELGFKAVLITGNPDYYGRFGFVPASRFGVRLPDIQPGDEAAFFMAKELEEGWLDGNAGIYDFDEAYFDLPESELEEYEKLFEPKAKREARETDLP